MYLTVLGCEGGFPSAGGACSGYLLEHDGSHLLIDCGAGALAKMLEYTDIDALDGIILTHLHYDHMSDVLCMIYRIGAMLTAGALKAPPRLLMPCSPKEIAALLTESGAFRPHYFDPKRRRGMGSWFVDCLPVKHSVPTYAVRVTNADDPGTTFVYTSDTTSYPPLVGFAKEADLLLVSTPKLGYEWTEADVHMSSELAAGLAYHAEAHRLVLTHQKYGCKMEQVEEACMTFKRTIGAYPGLVVPVFKSE